MHPIRDAQEFQDDVVFGRPRSSVTLEQAHRGVTSADDESTNKRTTEKTSKQTADVFMQDSDGLSKSNVANEQLDGSAPPPPPRERSGSSTSTSPSETRGLEAEGVTGPKISPIDRFTPLEAAAISCVLKECLEQLATVGFTIPASVDLGRWDETFKTLDEMYGTPDEPKTIFREDVGLPPLVPTAAEKMQRDRNYVCTVLERVLCDVRDNRKFDSLQEEIDRITRIQEDKRNLETSERIWHGQTEQLRKTLRHDKIANVDDTEETIRRAQESDAQVDHAILLSSGKLGYTERWAEARLEQQELKLHLQKRNMLDELSDYWKEHNTEQMISAETLAYLKADMEEKENQLVTWTTRYNEELLQRQQEIDVLKQETEKQKLEIDEMRSLRDKRWGLINECVIEVKRLREETEHRSRLNKAATIVQSIWRGYMVRQGLGKYKNLRKRLKRRKKLDKKKTKAKR